MEVNWKEVGLVALAGAIGGALSLIYSMTVGVPPVIEAFPWGFFAYLALGAGAGVFGVYLVAKTDTRYAIHCLAFAAACGVSWAPIFDGTSALVKNNRERAVNAKVASKTEEAKVAIQNLRKATDQELPTAASFVARTVSDLLAIAPEATDRYVSISVAQSIDGAMDALQTVHQKNPTIANQATSEIVAAATAAQSSGSPALMPFIWSPIPGSVGRFAYEPGKKRDGGS